MFTQPHFEHGTGYSLSTTFITLGMHGRAQYTENIVYARKDNLAKARRYICSSPARIRASSSIFLTMLMLILCGVGGIYFPTSAQTLTPERFATKQFATERFIIDSLRCAQKNYAIERQRIRILEDPTLQLSFRDAQALFGTNAAATLNSTKLPLRIGSAYWLCLDIENTMPANLDWMLYLGDSELRATGRNSFIDVYVVQNDRLRHYYPSGYHRPARERSIPTVFNAVELRLPAHTPTRLFIRLQRIYGFSVNPVLSLIPPIEFERARESARTQHLAISFLLLGTFVITIFFYGIYAFIMRDPTYHYFVGNVMGTLLLFAYLFGTLHHYCFPNFPTAENYCFFLALFLTSLEPLFVRKFLRMPTLSPRAGKFLLAAFVFQGGVSSLAFVVWLVWQDFPLVNNIVLLTTTAIAATQLTFSFVFLRSRTTLVRYIVAGNILLYGTSLVFLLVMWLPIVFHLPPPIDFSNAVYIACAGASGRIALFALGFGHRTKMLEEDRLKAQEDHIRQLQRNEELQRLQNQELETKVRERTAELENINEQLTEANGEIERQMIILEEQAGEIEVRNAEMHEINQALSAANEFKMKMLGIAAHDLKNPISNILLSTQILTRKVPSKALEEYTETIRESGEQMLSIIDDLLESAAIGLGKVELDLHSFDVVKTLENVCNHYGRVLETKQQHLSIAIPKTCIIQGDEGRIRQVADNLLSNASKYSPRGSTITIVLETLGEMVQIAVRDEGPGLTDHDKANLFGMFQRLSAQPTGGESSSGVGLASVKNIVELHGGTIDVQSNIGEGSTFIIRLPIIAG